MRFGREKRLLLGVLALLAPLPLPFNGVVGWPWLLIYFAAVALFLSRTWRGADGLLPAWAMNLLALAYTPFFLFDLSVWWRGRLLQPLVHLAMFALAVKLFAVGREKDKWHVFLVAFFLFLASMGSSVHPSVILFLFAFLALALLTLARFAGYHVFATAGESRIRPTLPLGGFIAAAIFLAVLAATPIFTLLPRLRQPYLVGPAAALAGPSQAAGFTDQLTLDTIGRVRTSRSVVLRYGYDSGRETLPGEGRLRAATYDLFRDNGWRRIPPNRRRMDRSQDGFFRLGAGSFRSWMSVWLRRAGNSALVLPVETLALDLPARNLVIDEAGVVSLPFRPEGTVAYRVGLGEAPLVAAREPGPEGLERFLDPEGATPRIAGLAAQVMGSGPPEERAARLEEHLQTGYRYTLDLGRASSGRPLERFLFDTRAGHCEYFASSMVVMLRSQGIPARLVTGYLGAEYNPLEKYFIVRQSNAHAWVETWVEGSGWRFWDPTPAAGRPLATSSGFGLLLDRAYDYLLFRWDRYVLTYGFFDQVGLFSGLRNLWLDFWGRWREEGDARATPLDPAPEAPPEEEPAAAPQGSSGPPALLLVLPLLAALIIAAAAWWRRRHLDARRAYLMLRSALERDGPAAALGPLEVEDRLARRFPEAAGETRKVVDLYLRETFAGEKLGPEEREELRGALRLAQALRRRKRAA